MKQDWKVANKCIDGWRETSPLNHAETRQINESWASKNPPNHTASHQETLERKPEHKPGLKEMQNSDGWLHHIHKTENSELTRFSNSGIRRQPWWSSDTAVGPTPQSGAQKWSKSSKHKNPWRPEKQRKGWGLQIGEETKKPYNESEGDRRRRSPPPEIPVTRGIYRVSKMLFII